MEDCRTIWLPMGQVVAFSRAAPYKTNGEPNEDGLAIIQVDEDNFVLAVADGVGGSPTGSIASAIVLDVLASAFSLETPPAAITAVIIAAVEQAHQEIRSMGTGSASTIAIAHISPEGFRSAHVGDSIVTVCGQRGRVKFETISHSPVGYAVEAGVLSADEAFSHEERHIVSNIVGGQDMHITLGGTQRLAARDTLMIASDGVTDNLRGNEIVDAIRKGPLDACGRHLALVASERMSDAEAGKPDDMTFILYRQAKPK